MNVVGRGAAKTAASVLPTVNHDRDVVFVVEDDLCLRTALASLIRSVGLGVEVFDSAAEFLAHRRARGTHCLLLDVRLPDANGLELQRMLAAVGDQLPIIFMTGHADIRMSVLAMKAGAVDFLPKPFPDDDLLAAVDRALESARLRLQQEEEMEGVRTRIASLTAREREVMLGIVRGQLNKQVAAQLGVSELTVKVHRRRVMRKMSASSLAELVHMVDRLS
jgi:FixJ family two-component response regulator